MKKSVPFPKMSTQIRKRLLAITLPKEKFLRRAKRRQTISDIEESKDEKGRGAYLTRLSLDSKNSNRCNESLPPTPPTSVSAPPTPPASGSTSTVSDLSNDCLESASTKDVKVGEYKVDLLSTAFEEF